jgi:putative glutamine amidotransferase
LPGKERFVQRPLIGITPDLAHQEAAHGPTERLFLNLDYAQAVWQAGGIPVVLPPIDEPEAFLSSLNGLLLTGGGDIDPQQYGAATTHPLTYGVSETRDRFEIALIRAALERDLPVLAICRGIQVLNVALGGTLYQHLPDEIPNALNHRQHELGIPSGEVAHPVTIVPESLLARIIGTTELMVNSYHHQAVATLATPLRVVAVAPDGVIEAVELPGQSFVLAVQWHPERLFERFPAHFALFAALVDAARATRLRQQPALARIDGET